MRRWQLSDFLTALTRIDYEAKDSWMEGGARLELYGLAGLNEFPLPDDPPLPIVVNMKLDPVSEDDVRRMIARVETIDVDAFFVSLGPGIAQSA